MPNNDKYDNRWSPFDPKWYQQVFDKFINSADMLFNQNAIIEQGYHIPDADGSRSSVFRSEAVLNNSFNEHDLRETLKDIYLNSSNRLVAANHDNVHFFQWHGYMEDMTIIPNTNYCEYRIPTENLIYASERDAYKLSQFYRKWIKVEDILNNWNIFKWHMLLFINQRIYSEYELRIDDHEVTIRFRYYDFWVKENYPIYIYKFDTSASCRILISKELCQNQWNWKMPVKYITDTRVANATNLMVAINKTSDSSIRRDGQTKIEVLGDNLEFLKIEDGYVDLTGLSDFNKAYILSENTEYLWMSLIVPKFFHEYPILLPTDTIYQPYEANLQPVVTVNYDMVQNAKSKFRDTGELKQVYVDLNDEFKKVHNGWKQLIRPVVLTDAFDENYMEPYARLLDDVNNLRDLTVKGADVIEEFRFFVKSYTNEEWKINRFKEYSSLLRTSIDNIRAGMHSFLDKLLVEYDQPFEELYKKFLTIMDDIDMQGIEYELFHTVVEYEREDKDLWTVISPLIHIPRSLADKYYVINIINDMRNEKVVWANMNDCLGHVRFQRPVDESDFWTFEYDADRRVWRPYPLSMTRHFPDVYIPSDPAEDTPSLNRIFKAFFFYSDTMNVVNEARDIERPTTTWDEDVQVYHFNQGAVYRDIFMEKFYWMGIRSIYKGLLATKNRWEVIEYIIDNESYERFNQLFLKTMDPYFKLGLATYLRSANFEFPFDDAISKMQESIDLDLLGYKRITNFEAYLNKTWIPSYFDYITKIMDNWDYKDRLLRRPRSTFDITRLLPILLAVQEDIYDATRKLVDLINWILEQLKKEDYKLNAQNIVDLKMYIDEMYNNIKSALTDTQELDLQIYSIDDINKIVSKLERHMELTVIIRNQFDLIYKDVVDHNVYAIKREILDDVRDHIDILPRHIKDISSIVNDFDMDEFMKVINELTTYLDHAKDNEDDNSLLGHVNKFNDTWSDWVKEHRNKLFQSTTALYGLYDPEKLYEDDEVEKFIDLLNDVSSGLYCFREVVEKFYADFDYESDQTLIDKFDQTSYMLSILIKNIDEYGSARAKLVDEYDAVCELLDKMSDYIGNTELGYRSAIVESFHEVIRSLSYIAGTNHRDDANIAMNNVNLYMTAWYSFIAIEEEVFDNLILLANPPIEIIMILDKHHDIIRAMMDYMDTVNIEFIPDSAWPTYSDVYQIDKIEVVTPGFEHAVGDIIFAPALGSYKITEISGNNLQAKSIEDTNYRNTTFRNPMVQYRPYDTITNGNGMGVTIKPISVTRHRIINDHVVDSIILRIKSTLAMIQKDLQIPNPHNNTDFSYVINDLNSILESWAGLINVYREYITDEMYVYVEDMVTTLGSLVGPCNKFIETRGQIILSEFIREFQEYIYDSYDYTNKAGLQNETFFYYDEILRTAFNEVCNFYGTGTTWSDGDALKYLMEETARPIRFYWKKIFKDLAEDKDILKIKARRDNLINMIGTTISVINDLPLQLIDITPIIRRLEEKLVATPTYSRDVWYQFKNVSVTIEGMEYRVGDIVQIIPEDLEINEVLLLQVTEVDDGRVIRIQPFMNYALPYHLWGLYKTKTLVGTGYGLQVDCFSYEIQLTDSTLLNDSKSDVSLLPPFDENDMMMFKFENIHDLNISYEVFIGGKQITNFVLRHGSQDNPLHPNNIDTLYINANEVMDLKNSSIYIPAEQYFVYKIDNIIIKDPGAGYCVGQDIFVDVDVLALRLKVAQLVYGPYKGIQSAILTDSGLLYEKVDPSIEGGRVVHDSMNNIDDEYNVGYYDNLPKDGIIEPATKSFDSDEYTFTSKRFDKLDGDNRNESFMYPDVDMPAVENAATNGDPDSHWYQGSRIDNSQVPMEDKRVWNGIMNLNPPTDPFIPDDRRTPPEQPVKGEYQLIQRERIHSSNDGDIVEMVPLTVPEVTTLWEPGDEPNDYDHDENNQSGVRQINSDETGMIWDGEDIDPNNPGNERIRLKTIAPIDVFRLWDGEDIPEDDNIEWGDIITKSTAVFDFNVDSLKNAAMIEGDLTVEHFADLPRHVEDFPNGAVGKTVIVEHDETNGNHRMLYRIRTFIAAGFFVYELPEVADYEWNTFNVNWMDSDWLADFPTSKAQYPEAPWKTATSYRKVMHPIVDGKVDQAHVPSKISNQSFINDLTVDDISVFNWSTKEWEDLHDETRWQLEVYNDDENQKWGFTLRFIKDGTYSYDMRLYLNKIPATQMKNAMLKRDATIDIVAGIHHEVNKAAINTSVYTGRHLRIRKLFPYEQKESFKVGFTETGEPLGYTMNFKLAPYEHFKNQIHLEDIKIFNKTAGRFENVLDPTMFEVRFKDPKAVSRGYETQTMIVQSLIGNPGQGFVDGDVWAWNAEYGIHVFGRVTANFAGDGHLLTFEPVHCTNPPDKDISLEFQVFQHAVQSQTQMAVVMIEFLTKKVEVYGDGYIHNVTNRLAPVPDEFQVIVQYDLDGIGEYDIIISKSVRNWTFMEPYWAMSPTFHIDDYNVQSDRLYVLTDKGRYPLVNPSTRKPTLHVTEVDDGTDVTFLNLYRRYQHFNLYSVPYPMRSVYVQRRIPKSGYIDLSGKINKPLNKKYFEFWVNGKLLYDEVTIITPTKIFLHGLKSLKNLEIIEVNRDPNEYFSDGFLEVTQSNLGRPYQNWNYQTYLDDALEGTLKGDNYTTEEQEYLISPVWPQVAEDHPEYKNYPPNVDIESDILLMTTGDDESLEGVVDNPVYQFLVIDPPTLEGKQIFEQSLTFEHFGFSPITDEMLIDMLNEEWKEEIEKDPHVPEHFIMSDDEWYGMAARLYDEYGIQVHNLNEAAYSVADTNLLRITTSTKVSRIARNPIAYDLT